MNAKADMICAVGGEMRDYGTLIRAIRDLNVRCHIAASGTVPGKKDKWIKAIEDASPLPSHITVDRKNVVELRELYARSHFVVIPLLPTDTDNGTTSILEAMAMGKAVICSRVEGQRDIVQEGKTGIFVTPQDLDALRKAIEYLLKHPEVAKEMGREGRRHLEKYHTLDQWVSDVKRIVEQVIAEKARDN